MESKEKARRKRLAAEMGEDGEKEFQGEEEEEEPLPEIFIPSIPCHILCGFYSEPRKFWVSLGDYDSGFLYHCEFPHMTKAVVSQKRRMSLLIFFLKTQRIIPSKLSLSALAKTDVLWNAKWRNLSLSILSQKNPSLTNMVDYWHFNMHANNYGYGLKASILALMTLNKAIKAKVLSPRLGTEAEPTPEDMENPKAYSIENARRKREHNKLMKEGPNLRFSSEKKEWKELYKSKPDDDYEDSQDAEAIRETSCIWET
ncbi:hypothetical protein GH733_002827 [Mirounga leonina]|nr:hypothetical protein GH733_002827 [Mirounga leonina]